MSKKISHQSQQVYQQQHQQQPRFEKKTEDDEDTLSLDSERSQGYIN